jgi:hypothetical protein
MNNCSTCAILALFTIASASTCYGEPITALIAKSDAIVTGVESTRFKTGKTVTFTLSVEKVFKGEIRRGDTLVVTWDSGTDGAIWPANEPLPNYRGLWFLTQTGQQWACVPVQPNFLHQFPLAFLPIADSGPPSELAYSEGTPLPVKLILETGVAKHRDPFTVVEAAYGVNSAEVLRLLRYLKQSTDPDTRLVGFAALLARRDQATLLEFEAEIPILSEAPMFNRVVAILTSYPTDDKLWVSFFGRMATSPEMPSLLAQEAAMVLSRVHTVDALPYLAELLESPKPLIQQYAVQGLSLFANGASAVTPESARTMEYLSSRHPTRYSTTETERHLGFDESRRAEYINFWRGWWNEHPELHSSN